jgi:hypothetical protein
LFSDERSYDEASCDEGRCDKDSRGKVDATNVVLQAMICRAWQRGRVIGGAQRAAVRLSRSSQPAVIATNDKQSLCHN